MFLVFFVVYGKFHIDMTSAFVNLFWPHFLGGCSITRDTVKSLKSAGSWSKIDLSQPENEPEYQVLPHVKGMLVK